VFGALIGYDIQRKIPALFATEEIMRAHGVNIIKLGEEITLVVQSNQLFVPNTPRLQWGAYPLLQLIDDYLRFFRIVRVDVRVYTDNQGDNARNDALSRQRAQEMVNFMWSDDSDIRLMVAKGMGARLPVASNLTAAGRAKNQHVEITFRIYNVRQVFVS
jgi:outer membrane protein OmpA-like peptidoglycan-associated protein